MATYNILYDRGDGTTSFYLGVNCDFRTAEIYMQKFRNKYVNQPYPNGKGRYPFCNPQIVGIRADGEMYLVT